MFNTPPRHTRDFVHLCFVIQSKRTLLESCNANAIVHVICTDNLLKRTFPSARVRQIRGGHAKRIPTPGGEEWTTTWLFIKCFLIYLTIMSAINLLQLPTASNLRKKSD